MKVVRQTENLTEPRIWREGPLPLGKERKVTCVHARIYEDGGFAGNFTETGHIGVVFQGILNTLHNVHIDVDTLTKRKKMSLEEFKHRLLRACDIIRDSIDEGKDALEVLKTQTKGKW